MKQSLNLHWVQLLFRFYLKCLEYTQYIVLIRMASIQEKKSQLQISCWEYEECQFLINQMSVHHLQSNLCYDEDLNHIFELHLISFILITLQSSLESYQKFSLNLMPFKQVISQFID